MIQKANTSKKLVVLLNQTVKSIAKHSDYQEVIGLIFQKPANLVASTSKLSSKTKDSFANFSLSKKDFSQVCKTGKSFKIDRLGNIYLFSVNQLEQNKAFNGISEYFSHLSSQNSNFDNWLITPLISSNQSLLGIILVSNPQNNAMSTTSSILPIFAFVQEFIRSNEKLSTEELKDQLSTITKKSDEKLKTVERTCQEFVAMLAHDMRSPLTAVSGTLDLLSLQARKKSEIKITPTISSLISVAHDTCKQVIHMVTELLDLSRMEYSPLQINKTPIIPQELVTKVAEECFHLTLEKHIRLNFGCDPSLKPILGDSHYLERALINLLSNAIKYTPENKEVWLEARSIVQTHGKKHSNYLVFTVIDSGSGILEEEQPYIFDPYYQASNRKGQLGIGLGLAIVKKIALAHGGEVSVKSQVGVGSAFSLSLPIED